MQFAKETSVSVAKSRAEIESVLARYGASEFMSGWKLTYAVVGFRMRGKMMRFTLPLPDKSNHSKSPKGRARSAESIETAWEQSCRQRWRALLLSIRAKLEAVECGITTFEEEFLAHIVMPDGVTLGEMILPQLPEYLSGKRMPKLLPGPDDFEGSAA